MNRKWRFFSLSMIAICVLVLGLTACSAQAQVVNELQIPNGYTFVSLTGTSNYTSGLTVYCAHKQTGRTFICSNGKLGNEIVPPDGYSFAGSYTYDGSTNYFCRLKGTERVYKCTVNQVKASAP